MPKSGERTSLMGLGSFEGVQQIFLGQGLHDLNANGVSTSALDVVAHRG
jgi:hypothetical protein